jgi:hypothetical protein
MSKAKLRLKHKHIFIQVIMQESIIDVNLPYSPTSRECKRQKSAYRSGFDDKVVGVAIVHTQLLVKYLNN